MHQKNDILNNDEVVLNYVTDILSMSNDILRSLEKSILTQMNRKEGN